MAMNRRKFLGAAAAGAALPSTVNIARAANRDTISIALAAAGPREADPNKTILGADNWATEQMFEQLVRPKDGMFGVREEDFVPTLAESWKSSDGARTWTFALRKGVKFHKGYGEMTSDDVVHSFDRARKGMNRANFFNVKEVVKDGDHSVVIRLNGPDPLFLGSSVFYNNASIVSKKADIEKGEGFSQDPVGTGPYELARFDQKSGIYVKAFDAYWGEKAKTPNLSILYISDTTARTLALLSGNADMIEAVRAPGWVDSMLKRDKTLKFDMTVPGSFNTLMINLTRKPFDDIRVRRALAHAMDQTTLATALTPMGGVVATINPPGFPAGFTKQQLPPELRYEHDINKAKDLLKEAGFPNGLDFESNCSQREDYSSTMLILQEQIRPAGFRMKLNMMDHTAFHAANRNDLNTLAMNSSSYPPIPTRVYIDYLSSEANATKDGKGGQNYSHYGVVTPGIDDQLKQALNATTYDEYLKICQSIELQVQRDLPAIGLSTLSYTIARNSRVDVGYDVKSGYARWRLHRATAA
ncbi:ABC transporter substrate-binding protein [Terrarubrum flagellatum]|uniref:ABC transporter substrate-binding protein n=1 Tax=Terrirubrum flagellatum TaxID=2895980 RepID=UPI00314561C9